MPDPNKYGLRRSDLPDPVRRVVRQECGFACVVCGRLGQHYDHFDPEFDEAREHRPEGIALLCATCHQDKTSGRLSNARVGQMRAVAKDKWKDPPWRCHSAGSKVRLRFGSNLLIGSIVGFTFGPREILRIDAGEDPIEPWLLSGGFAHGAGEVLRLERNDVVSCSGNWDVHFEGTLLTYRAGLGVIVAELDITDTEIALSRLNLQWPSGVELEVTRGGSVEFRNLKHTAFRNEATAVRFSECTVTDVPQQQFTVAGISIGNVRGAKMANVSVERLCVPAPRGVVDFQTIVNVEEFLSDDMLAL